MSATTRPLSSLSSKRPVNEGDEKEEIWFAAWSDVHKREYYWKMIETVDTEGRKIISSSETQWVLPTAQNFYETANECGRNAEVTSRYVKVSAASASRGNSAMSRKGITLTQVGFQRKLPFMMLLFIIPFFQECKDGTIHMRKLQSWALRQLNIEDQQVLNYIDDVNLDSDSNYDENNSITDEFTKNLVELKAVQEGSKLNRDAAKDEHDVSKYFEDEQIGFSENNQHIEETKPLSVATEKEMVISQLSKGITNVSGHTNDVPAVAFFSVSRDHRRIDANAALERARLYNRHSNENKGASKADSASHNDTSAISLEEQLTRELSNDQNVFKEDILPPIPFQSLQENELNTDDNQGKVQSKETKSFCLPFLYFFSKRCRKHPPFKNLENLINISSIQ